MLKRMAAVTTQQLIFRRIFVIILLNHIITTTKEMSEKVKINLNPLNRATILYGDRTYPIKKNIAQLIFALYKAEENPVSHLMFREIYLEYFKGNGKDTDIEDSTGFYRQAKFKFRRDLGIGLQKLVCYQQPEDDEENREDYEEKCSDRKDWIIKFYSVNEENFIAKNISNVTINFPDEEEASVLTVKKTDVKKRLGQLLDEKKYVELKRETDTMFDWAKDYFMTFSTSDLRDFTYLQFIATRAVSSDPTKAAESMKNFLDRNMSLLIDCYNNLTLENFYEDFKREFNKQIKSEKRLA